MIITNSPDISVLQVQVIWDISGQTPIISLVNMSTGAHLENIAYAFFAYSPSGTPIHVGNIDAPDKTGVWTTATLSDAFPMPNNQIEWSGAPYTFYVIAKDSIGNIYQTPTQNASICRPNGNTKTSKNNYGVSTSIVQVKCEQARIFFQDTTNSSYKGLTGIILSSVLKVLYPIDGTGNLPDPFTAANYVTALVPITYSSDAYQFTQNCVYQYDLGNYTLVNIKYLTISKSGASSIVFPVYCNIDLGVLQCEISKLINDVQYGDCDDMVSATKNLQIITGKFVLVTMGILQPLTGVDVPTLIQEIQDIGGFTCNCCNAPTGVIPNPTSIIDGYAFSVNKLGGDISTASNFSINGNNITLNIGDVTTVVTVNAATTTALTSVPTVSGDGFTKTYTLNLDEHQLSLELAAVIAANPDSYNAWNALFASNANFSFVVDGECIFQSTAVCDYTFVLDNIPANTNYALITSIKTGNTVLSLSQSFNQTNIALLQTYLNSLNVGVFAVTNGGSGNVNIVSDNNSFQLSNLTYKVAATNYIANQTTNCTGYVPIPANEFAAKIVGYLCGLNDSQVVTSADYQVCFLDSNGRKQTVTIKADTTMTSFINQMLTYDCQTIDYITTISGGAVSCDNMKKLFATSTAQVDASTLFYGYKGQNCAGISALELWQYMLTLNDATSISLFCDLVSQCGAGKPCEVIGFDLIATAHDTSCSNITGILYSLS